VHPRALGFRTARKSHGHACLVCHHCPYPLTKFQRPSYNLSMKGYPACACTMYHTCTARGQDFKLKAGSTYPPTRFGVDRYKHLTCSAEFGTQLVSWCLLRCVFATPLSPGTSFVAFPQHRGNNICLLKFFPLFQRNRCK